MRPTSFVLRAAGLTAAALVAACGAAPTATPTAVPTAAPPPALALKVMNTPWQSPSSIEAMCTDALAKAEVLRVKVKAPAEVRTVANTLEPFNDMLLAVDTADGLAGVTANMNPDKAVREAAEACERALAKFNSDVGLDRGMFDALVGLKGEGLDPLTRRFLKHTVRDFRRSGVDKDETVRIRIAAINEEMVKLSQSYGKAVREDVRFIEVDGPEALKGLPVDYIEAHKPDPKTGKIKITTDYPEFFPFQTYAVNAELRKALYTKFINRGSPANKATLTRILELRYEYATLLGYPTWAAYQAETKMVKTPERIDAFIKELVASVRPRSEKDLATLLVRKRKDMPEATRIETWDRFYYAAKVREEQHDFDAKVMRPYFSFPKVQDGLFELYGELFGVRFEKVDMPVWHPSVTPYAMYKGDELVGRFYLDMHPRDGKYKHAAMFPMQTGLEGDRVPLATLVCNFPDPSQGDGKALMEHREVQTFFHEFGHLIHHLMARKTKWAGLAGINVEWDFVEAPSQLLEEWTDQTEVLQRFAHHVETGEPVPAELVAKMRAAADFGRGVSTMRQVFYAAYSFYLHQQDPKGLDLDVFEAELYKTYSPFPAVEGTHTYGSFGHLVGYSSGYYTYQWSLVIAKDLLTRFKAEGMMNKQTMAAYRDLVLVPGGTKDAADLIKDFLGRDYNMKAYQAWLAGEK